ncbi:hypothetical protein CUJ83_13635 [Methanocella sp. CWC-04]|uniref:Uncharacterized protein n=1 Tax=Methanooceanicella nereidis TaxID=2052831 RepID=A0AAP2W5X1_9EURY|nr:flagellin [Methanocella sp. CWC-04]MCD1296040.1 hypothetical protein [Methanocella sp. CWC-04]
MAQEVMSSALLMIATIIATVALINAVYPSIYGMTGSITVMSNTVNDRMKCDVKFVYETSSAQNSLTVWMKNTGKTQVFAESLEHSDVFYGKIGDVMTRAGYDAADAPKWTYVIENDNGNSIWDPSETIKISLSSPDDYFTSGDHRVRVVLYNGIYVEDAFTL